MENALNHLWDMERPRLQKLASHLKDQGSEALAPINIQTATKTDLIAAIMEDSLKSREISEPR